MLTHPSMYSPSMLAHSRRSVQNQDIPDGIRYGARQQELATASRSGTPLSVAAQPSMSDFTTLSAGHHPPSCHPPLPHPIEISSTSKLTSPSSHHFGPLSSVCAANDTCPSPPALIPSYPMSLRYDVVLEAPPAVAQRTEDSPLTYLNKSQFYSVKLTDMESYDGILTSTLTLMFHEESHRRVSGNYWRFWFGQQKDPQTSRAIDINVSRCSGIQNVQHDKFDRVTFDWNGRRGASIHVRFNCLSTDFSRIKGVKGIPLRLHMETSQAYASLYPTHPVPASFGNCQQQQTTPTTTSEAVYCKIKLFRDKGAERKNKDDTRQLERQMEKLRGKHGKMHHPLWLAHQRAQPFTVFSEIPECLSPPTPIVHHHPSPTLTSAPGPSSSLFLHNHAAPLASPPSSVGAAAAATASGIFTMPLTPPRGIKRSVGTMLQQDDGLGHSSTRGMLMMANGDPSYSPFVQRRVAKRSFYARFPSSELYRAIYLEELSVKDFIAKVSPKIPWNGPVQNVVRQVLRKDSNSMISVSVDDAMVEDIQEEQDMDIGTKVDQDGMMTLVLRY